MLFFRLILIRESFLCVHHRFLKVMLCFAYQFLGLLTDVGTEQVLQVFPSVANQFSPLFYVDHAAAL